MVKSTPQRFQTYGIHGYILQKIKLKLIRMLKNMNGKNLTHQIRQVRQIHIIHIKKIMKLKKNIQLGKINLLIFLFLLVFSIKSFSTEKIYEGNFIELKLLDKISSKNYKINIKIGEEKIFKNISIKPLKCKNSKFDDNPEIIAYLQVKDLKNVDNDEVFVFNGWTFSSSPSINTFDHPVYDLWLEKCIY